MLNNKEMLVKVASYDKAICVVADAVIRFKDAMNKQAAYTNLPVAPSNAYQGALADQLKEGPRTMATAAAGGGLGLLLGLLAGAAQKSTPWSPRSLNMGVGGINGLALGTAGALGFEGIRRTIKAKKDVEGYRTAEAQQNGVSDETSEEKEKKAKEVKTASVKSILDSVLNKQAAKKATVRDIFNKVVNK